MDVNKKKILQCIQKFDKKYFVNKKQIKAKKKKLRKARNHLLSLENCKSEPLRNDKRIDLSEWESSFLRKSLIEAQETIKKISIEILRSKEVLKTKEQDLERSKEEIKGYKEILERHCLTIETLNKAIKKKNKCKEMHISESSFVLEKKIKDLNAELREQRAKSRQLKSELNAFHENYVQTSEEIGLSDISGVVNIKITKEKEISNHRKPSKGAGCPKKTGFLGKMPITSLRRGLEIKDR